MLHRDLKPANVLLGTDGRAYLTDFGVARMAGEMGLTGTGELIGTQRYLAPEVLAGHPADVRADLYSCGVLLAECAGPDVQPVLSALIARLTHPDPSRRPASAADALLLLTPGGEPTAPIRPPAPVEPAPTLPVRLGPAPASRAPGPSRWFVALVAAAVLLATGGVVASATGGGEAAEPVAPAGDSLSQRLADLEAAIDAAAK